MLRRCIMEKQNTTFWIKLGFYHVITVPILKTTKHRSSNFSFNQVHISCLPIWGFLGSAGVGVYAQARLLPPGHEAGEPAVHGSRPSQDRGLWFGSGDQVPAALHGLRVHALVPGTGGPPQKVQRKVLLSVALTVGSITIQIIFSSMNYMIYI